MARIRQPRPNLQSGLSRIARGRLIFGRGLKRLFGGQSLNFYYILGITMLIVLYGAVMVLSSSSVNALTEYKDSYHVFWNQVKYGGFGVLGMFAFSMLSVSRLRKLARAIFGAALLLQLAIFVTGRGVSVYGNQNWLDIGFATIQPSEFLKFGLIVFIANSFAKREADIYDVKRFINYNWFFIIIALGLVLKGSDLGTAMVIATIAIGMTYMTGVDMKMMRHIWLLVIVATFIFVVTGPSRLARISAWWPIFLGNYSDDSSNNAWQAVHGIWALAAGGWGGVGLGHSKLKWAWIPEVDNDYIFAIIGEETGLLGALVVLGLFVLLTFRMRNLFLRTRSTFMRNATAGIMIWIGAQSLINIAVVVQLLPVLGVPLPLISSGGSSLISSLFAIGVLLSFERQIHQEELLEAQGVTPLSKARARSVRAGAR
ncbi:MAG: hypothetical protein RL196_336 [Actinomycetota bacterium]